MNNESQLENIMENYKNRFSEKTTNSNISIFIGSTTGVIVALEKKLRVIPMGFDLVKFLILTFPLGF